MNILHIEDESWDSGIAHYALTLAQEQARRGWQVHFWGQSGSYPCLKAREAKLQVREISRPWLSLHELRRELKARKIQLINAHTGSGHSLAAAAVAGLAIPLVRTRGDARRPSNNALARGLARRTKAYIAANSQIKAQLSEAYPGARVELVFQGISASAPAPLEPSAVIGILGRLDPVKGHEDFIVAAKEAVRTYPKARFLVAGSGSKERIEKLRAWSERLGLKDNVEFLGFVADAADFIARCRIGVVASLESEAVSRAALEWMSQGRPLIATKVGCLPDMIEDDKSGVLAPAGHPGQIALAIKNLLKTPQAAEKMGARGRALFDERFSLKRFADDTETLYADVVRAARR